MVVHFKVHLVAVNFYLQQIVSTRFANKETNCPINALKTMTYSLLFQNKNLITIDVKIQRLIIENQQDKCIL